MSDDDGYRYLKVGLRFDLYEELFEVVSILDNPNQGIAVIECVGRESRFAVPAVMIESLMRLRNGEE